MVRTNTIKFLLVAVIIFILYEIIAFMITHPPESSGKQEMVSGDLLVKIPIKVSVYYEALCPDSRHFILHQLKPFYEKASRIIDYELVPYGKAKTEEQIPPGNRYKFQCQHGAVECHANKVHACAIQYIKEKDVLLKYISCMINNNMNPEEIAQECSNQFSVELQPILQCANGVEGEVLLKNYGEMTYQLDPRVTFIPTVLINDNQYKQALILKNLKESVCSMFPEQSQPEECGS